MIVLKEIAKLKHEYQPHQVALTDKTMHERHAKVLNRMHDRNIDVLVIYEDLEHGSNFEYLTGFLTRFEEACLVLHANGQAYLLLGNENLKMSKYSRLEAVPIHVPFFSLPNQPMMDDKPFTDYLEEAGIQKGQRVGLVGWKVFTSKQYNNCKLFDVPYYIVDALTKLAGVDNVSNVTDLFIGGAEGVRCTDNANEIAHYAYGADLASECVFDAINAVTEGIRECDLGQYLGRYGQRNSVVSIASAGNRFEKANLYPSEKQVRIGEKMSFTAGFKGGLTSRAGYAVRSVEELPKDASDYINALAVPYFRAVVEWLESIRIGMNGEELYNRIEQILPKEQFHWTLNPGHTIADEEWMASPIYPGSMEKLRSGMLLQIDIIPSIAGMGGVGCESGIALAAPELRDNIKNEYPELYTAFMRRRDYIMNTLHIKLRDEVLPMSDTVAYYPPFFMSPATVFCVE